MQKALLQAHFYPDGGGYYLREAIAERFGVTRANVILGAAQTRSSSSSGKRFSVRATR